jgi:hypothetical protein
MSDDLHLIPIPGDNPCGRQYDGHPKAASLQRRDRRPLEAVVNSVVLDLCFSARLRH